MARHAEFSMATGVEVYFCDPTRPWQRGTSESAVVPGVIAQQAGRGEWQ